MSKTKKGPFDAAIKILRSVIRDTREEIQGGDWDNNVKGVFKTEITSCRSAIRVLEAAGKVGKEATLCAFLTICDIAKVAENNQFVEEICALLESLLDKEEK